MKTQELREILEAKGFHGKEKDSGFHYSKTLEHIKLICYIEPEVEVQFVTQYRWKNNDVKGTYNISVKELGYTKLSVPQLFRMTKENLPAKIGLSVDTHKEVDEVIDRVFSEDKSQSYVYWVDEGVVSIN